MMKIVAIPALIAAISAPRLGSYRKFFQPKTDEELLGIYRWHEDLCGAFSRNLAWVEVVLRNRFHEALSRRFGAGIAGPSRDWYNHIQLSSRSRDSVRKITHTQNGNPRRPAATPDDVVAKLTFGFWPALLDLEKDIRGTRIAWGDILIEVVPGHRQSAAAYWQKLAHRDALFARLDLCRDLRNRIAHHEPIWKQGVLYEETKPRVRRTVALVAPAPKTPTEALARLQLQHDRVMELLHWLSPDVAHLVKTSPAHQHGAQLLSMPTLDAYRQAHFDTPRP
jgi:Abi-like protein